MLINCLVNENNAYKLSFSAKLKRVELLDQANIEFVITKYNDFIDFLKKSKQLFKTILSTENELKKKQKVIEKRPKLISIRDDMAHD